MGVLKEAPAGVFQLALMARICHSLTSTGLPVASLAASGPSLTTLSLSLSTPVAELWGFGARGQKQPSTTSPPESGHVGPRPAGRFATFGFAGVCWTCCLQCFDAVGLAAGRASGL